MFQSSSKKGKKGQGLVEYALILVLVAVVVIAALMVLGPTVGNVFSTINVSLGNVASSDGGSSIPPGYNFRHSAPCDRADEILIDGSCYGP